MKEILAILRTSRVNQTKKALTDAGFAGFTGAACLGRGKKLVDPGLLKLLIDDGNLPMSSVGEAMTEATRLIARRIFFIVTPDNRVREAVEAIIAANSTGKPGDGKIFVLPIQESYSVRLGDRNEV